MTMQTPRVFSTQLTDWLKDDTSLRLIAVRVHSLHCAYPLTVKAVLNLTAFPSNGTEAQYSKVINTWCAIPLQSVFSPQRMINVHVEYPRSCCVKIHTHNVYRCSQSHTTHFAIVYYLTTRFNSEYGHHQAIIQEHECTHKVSTARQEISPFYIKIHLKCIYNV
jgi:hypothetical protein